MNNEIYSEYISFCLQGDINSLKVVNNGLDAISSLKEETWDKVIIGITLEYYNGLEVIGQFREFQHAISQNALSQNSYYNPEFIIVTRIRNEKSKKNAASLGVTNYLNTPVDTTTLLKLITDQSSDFSQSMEVLCMNNLQLIKH